ncbi:hypothetical protein HDU78_005345 [Chytriomyces hyalinus]|nr:hypothetical protein HDU78_005345 [Chytriomyces hyalinus]
MVGVRSVRYNLKLSNSHRLRFEEPYDDFLSGLLDTLDTVHGEAAHDSDDVVARALAAAETVALAKGPAAKWTVWVSLDLKNRFQSAKAEVCPPGTTHGVFTEMLLIIRESVRNHAPISNPSASNPARRRPIKRTLTQTSTSSAHAMFASLSESFLAVKETTRRSLTNITSKISVAAKRPKMDPPTFKFPTSSQSTVVGPSNLSLSASSASASASASSSSSISTSSTTSASQLSKMLFDDANSMHGSSIYLQNGQGSSCSNSSINSTSQYNLRMHDLNSYSDASSVRDQMLSNFDGSSCFSSSASLSGRTSIRSMKTYASDFDRIQKPLFDVNSSMQSLDRLQDSSDAKSINSIRSRSLLCKKELFDWQMPNQIPVYSYTQQQQQSPLTSFLSLDQLAKFEVASTAPPPQYGNNNAGMFTGKNGLASDASDMKLDSGQLLELLNSSGGFSGEVSTYFDFLGGSGGVNEQLQSDPAFLASFQQMQQDQLNQKEMMEYYHGCNAEMALHRQQQQQLSQSAQQHPHSRQQQQQLQPDPEPLPPYFGIMTPSQHPTVTPSFGLETLSFRSSGRSIRSANQSLLGMDFSEQCDMFLNNVADSPRSGAMAEQFQSSLEPVFGQTFQMPPAMLQPNQSVQSMQSNHGQQHVSMEAGISSFDFDVGAPLPLSVRQSLLLDDANIVKAGDRVPPPPAYRNTSEMEFDLDG